MAESNPLDSLEKTRTVFLSGRITRESIGIIIKNISLIEMESSGKPIQLLINSGGGQSEAAFMLCDFIKFFVKSPVHAIVFGQCSSAATFVLLACERRMCTPFSRFVIHSGTLGVDIRIDRMTEKKLRDLLDDLMADSRKVISYYAERLNMSEEEAAKLVDRGDQEFNESLSAEEAKQIGLITEIMTEKFTIFPNSKGD